MFLLLVFVFSISLFLISFHISRTSRHDGLQQIHLFVCCCLAAGHPAHVPHAADAFAGEVWSPS